MNGKDMTDNEEVGTDSTPDNTQSSLVSAIVCPPKRSMPSKATLRWRILSTAVHTKTPTTHTSNGPQLGSIRRFESFGLIRMKRCSEEDTDRSSLVCAEESAEGNEPKKQLLEGKWFECRLRDNRGVNSFDNRFFEIKILTERIPISELLNNNSSDNTGNVCLWPSEEVLSYYIYKNRSQFNGKRVLELGGGMTCLCGLVTAIFTAANDVIVTDGNQRCVTNAQTIVGRNGDRLQTRMSCRRLDWGQDSHYDDLRHRIDVIVCSDCLYFAQSHRQLVDTIRTLLNPSGVAIILAPKRGPTFDTFVDSAKQWFDLQITDDYDQLVTELHRSFSHRADECHYNADLHYPVMVRLTNKSNQL